MKSAHSEQRHYIRNIYVALLLSSCACHSENAHAQQVELRPQIAAPATITGAAQNNAQSPTTDTTLAAKQPLGMIASNLVDVNLSAASAPSKKLRAVRIKVTNRSDTPIIFDGNRCTVVSQSSGRLIAKCISQKQLDTVGRPPTTFSERFSADLKDTVTAAASVGVVQTAKTFAVQAGPIEKRYEYDRERQNNEESRFGQRLVYPGESTNGNIYFDKNISLDNGAIQIPVKSLYDASAEATLSRQIRLTTEDIGSNRVQE